LADIDRYVIESDESDNSASQSAVMPDLTGIPLIQALAYLKKMKLKLGSILYEEQDFPNFTVVNQSINAGEEVKKGASINLKLACSNPIRYLPSIYQSDDTLKNFLYIFMHILNSITFKLDNIQRYYNPMEAPKDFYKWLASWFSLNVNYVISEEKMRHLIKNVVSLHQWRGTVVGLARYLEILTDVKPDIIENYIPYNEYVIKGDKLVENFILANKTSRYHFTVSFPVSAQHFSFETLKSIYQVVASEKPAHADFYIIFKPDEQDKVRSSFIIGEDLIK